MTKMTYIDAKETTEPLPSTGVRPGADAGNPQTSQLPIASESGTRVGLWECTSGGWEVVDRPEAEACYILSGEAVITDHDAGAKYTVTAGDVVVFPKGFNGRWDVTRTIRKFYAVY